MGNNSNVSGKTLVISAVIAIFSGILPFSSSTAGTLGTETETERLQAEVTEARNSLDKALLEKGAKPDDPKIKAKTATLDEKMKAFRKAFQDSQTPPKDKNKNYKNAGSERPSGVTPAAKAEPETVLSGEGIQGEITYQKKKKSLGTKKMNTEPTPEASATPAGSGLSEIQYPKKKSK